MSARSRYSGVAMVMHWAIALLIISNLAAGWRMESLKGLAQFELFQLHKSIGITVLVLSVLRLAWRLFNPPPAYAATMKGWEKLLAHIVHWAFYAIMIGLPLTGWIVVSASAYNIPTLLYHSIPWPHIGFIHDLPMASRKAIEEGFGNAHGLMAFGTAGLLILHVAAALKHQFIDRDHIFSRMIPGLGGLEKN